MGTAPLGVAEPGVPPVGRRLPPVGGELHSPAHGKDEVHTREKGVQPCVGGAQQLVAGGPGTSESSLFPRRSITPEPPHPGARSPKTPLQRAVQGSVLCVGRGGVVGCVCEGRGKVWAWAWPGVGVAWMGVVAEGAGPAPS